MSEYRSFPDFKSRAGYEIDGAWYPRVTSILSIKAKPGLYRYYAGMASFSAAQEATERSAQEGTRVHDAIEAILRGHQPIVDDATRGAVEAFGAFSNNTHVRPLMIEERLLSKDHHYAGTVDVVAEIDGVVGVLDIKTSMAIYREYGLQTAAYVQALREGANLPQPQTSWILRLDQCQTCDLCGATLRNKGGNLKIRGGMRRCHHTWGHMQGIFDFQEVPHYEENIQAFLAAKQLWEWEHKDYLAKLK